MVSFPPCKINLGLYVINKRVDGYHNLQTCFYPVPWNDVLEIIPSKPGAFATTGIPIPGASKDNLCFRAYEMLKKDFGLPTVSIHLHKVVPIGGGLGGGSSDGAYTLRALNELFNLTMTSELLLNYASILGSDCPFFIGDEPMLGTEKGNVLTPVKLSLKGKYLVIVTPEVQISTAEAYASILPGKPAIELRSILEDTPLTEWKGKLKNVFEDTIFKKFPVIEALYQKMYALGADYASLSGSGSSVYGIFQQEVRLKHHFETFSYWSGYLR